MNYTYVIDAVLTMGGLAALLGLVLSIASIKLHVETDPKIVQIAEVLPGTNCGACGLPGCEGAAEAIANGDAPYNVCVAGGYNVATKVAAIIGVEAEDAEVKKVAVVGCGGGSGKVKICYLYDGISQCAAANELISGPLACDYGCLGFGDCVISCPFDALHMGDDKLPKVDREKCTACGICVSACPRGIMKLVQSDGDFNVSCNSKDQGKNVRKVCEVGCIACKICEKSCPEEPSAITVDENLAEFNYESCTNCGVCFEKCPTKCIQSAEGNKRPVSSSVKKST